MKARGGLPRGGRTDCRASDVGHWRAITCMGENWVRICWRRARESRLLCRAVEGADPYGWDGPQMRGSDATRDRASPSPPASREPPPLGEAQCGDGARYGSAEVDKGRRSERRLPMVGSARAWKREKTGGKMTKNLQESLCKLTNREAKRRPELTISLQKTILSDAKKMFLLRGTPLSSGVST